MKLLTIFYEGRVASTVRSAIAACEKDLNNDSEALSPAMLRISPGIRVFGVRGAENLDFSEKEKVKGRHLKGGS